MAKSARKQGLTKSEFDKLLLEYASINLKKKSLEKQEDTLKAILKEHIQKFGKMNDSGSYRYELEHGNEVIEATNTKRVSVGLVGDAVDILKKAKMTDFIETIEVVREDLLKPAIASKQVPDKLAAKLYQEKLPVFAFSVSVKTKKL